MLVSRVAWRFLIGACAIGCLAAAAPAGAEENVAERKADSQNAIATGGWMATGGVRVKDGRGTTYAFLALLMRPSGDVEGNGPQRPGEPDLRKPWVALLQTSTDALGKNRTECVSLANPTSAVYQEAGPDGLPAVFADIRCDDARGYDAYRVEWKGEEPLQFGRRRSSILRGPFQEYWSSPYVYDKPHYPGGVTWTTFNLDTGAAAAFRVCGLRDGQAECLVPVGSAEPWGYGAFVGGWTAVRASTSRVERTTCC